jgi:lysophospholipase L1-like esterase
MSGTASVTRRIWRVRRSEAPFFYDLLAQNDDAKWPASAGLDLKTKYPGITVVKNSKAGATTNGLITQVDGLPATLEGPVLVTITIGGNDVQSALGSILTSGSDAKQRATFQTNLDNALGKLTAADRVQVTVLLANVYDPSDGSGNFTYQGTKCPGALGYWPSGNATDPLLGPWEQIMIDTSAKYPQVKLLDLHTRFHGHGVAASPTWFVNDCIHPNAPGHDQVRGLFWDAIAKL